MLWVGLFVVGMIGLLSGLVPWILNGTGFRAVAMTVIGMIVLAVGAAGTFVRPQMDRFAGGLLGHAEIAASAVPATPAADPVAPPPIEAPMPAAPPPNVRVVGTETVSAAPAPIAPDNSASKDESQLPPSRPVSVPTTVITGTETDPIASAAEPPAAPPPPAAGAVPSAAAPETGAPDAMTLAALADQQPKDEASFTQAMIKGRVAFSKADDAGRGAAQAARAAAACSAVPKPDVKNWVGAVKSIDKDEGGRQMLTVTLSDGTLVKTWNNAMSDADDKTLIDASSPLAANLGKLKTGDSLRFSGSFFPDDTDCVRSTRLGVDQSMMEPSYLFRFTGLAKL